MTTVKQETNKKIEDRNIEQLGINFETFSRNNNWSKTQTTSIY